MLHAIYLLIYADQAQIYLSDWFSFKSIYKDVALFSLPERSN